MNSLKLTVGQILNCFAV